MPRLAETSQQAHRARRQAVQFVLAAFLLPLLATLATSGVLHLQVQRRTEARFARRVELVARLIQERIDAQIGVLRSYQALVAAVPRLEAPDWRAFTDALDPLARAPATVGVAFVTPEAISATAASSVERYPVRFLEPATAAPFAIGLDLGSDPGVRQRLEAARDQATPVVLAEGATLTLAFPVYRRAEPTADVAGRRAALAGWVCAAYRTKELLQGLASAGTDDLRVVVDGAAASSEPAPRLYDSVPGAAAAGDLKTTASLRVGDAQWRLTLTAQPSFHEVESGPVALGVQIGGGLTSLLLGGLVWTLASNRIRALELAGNMTRALRESETRVRAVVAHVADALLTYDARGILLSLNPAAESLFATEPREAVGRPVTELIPAAPEVPPDGLRHQATGRRADGDEMQVEVAVTEMTVSGEQHRVALVRDVTEQRRMEEALREGEERYRSLIASLQEGIVMHDAQGAIIACNASAERILGQPAHQLMGRAAVDPGWQAIREDDTPFPADEQPATLVLRTGRACSNVIMGITKPGGALTWISASAEPMLRAGERQPYAVVTSFTDISERRAAEAALKQSQSRLAHFLDGVPVGVLVMDREGRPTFANHAARLILGQGLTTGAAIGDPFGEAFVIGTNEPYPTERMPIVRALRGESSSVQDLEVRHAGKSAPLEVVATPIFDALGRVEYAIAAVQDVSERRRGEAALRASEERTRAVIDAMLEGLVIVNESAVIESVNAAAERVFGYTASELVGQPLTLLMPPRDAEGRAALLAALRKALGRITEWEGRRRNGEVFPFELSLYAFEAAGSRHFAGHVRDVSQRREVERLKKEFVATVSHELRTPLTSIRGSLGLLASGVLGELPDEAREVVAIAERNSTRLISLINDILDLERLEASRLEMNITRVSLRGVVERSFESVRAMAEAAGIGLVAGSSEIDVLGDGDRLVQVLVNLLSNAIKFSPRGASVRIESQDLGSLAELRVIDHGRGIPRPALEIVFERFKQVEASDARAKGGTGLGLAICRAILNQHGGSIGVNSQEGLGSTFWFRLPKPQEATPDGLLGALEPSAHDACDVLLVDDDAELLGVLARQLLREGLKVKTAGTLAEGLHRAREAPLRLLVLDLGLPDGEGASLISALRSDPARNTTPLLVYTGREIGREERGGLTLGPTRYLTKSKASDAQFRAAVLELLGPA